MTRLSREERDRLLEAAIAANYEIVATGGPKKYTRFRTRRKAQARAVKVGLPTLDDPAFQLLCQELTVRRQAAGLSQQQLAKAANTTQRYISELENNRINPTLDSLLQICEALNCQLKISLTIKK